MVEGPPGLCLAAHTLAEVNPARARAPQALTRISSYLAGDVSPPVYSDSRTSLGSPWLGRAVRTAAYAQLVILTH